MKRVASRILANFLLIGRLTSPIPSTAQVAWNTGGEHFWMLIDPAHLPCSKLWAWGWQKSLVTGTAIMPAHSSHSYPLFPTWPCRTLASWPGVSSPEKVLEMLISSLDRPRGNG